MLLQTKAFLSTFRDNWQAGHKRRCFRWTLGWVAVKARLNTLSLALPWALWYCLCCTHVIFNRVEPPLNEAALGAIREFCWVQRPPDMSCSTTPGYTRPLHNTRYQKKKVRQATKSLRKKSGMQWLEGIGELENTLDITWKAEAMTAGCHQRCERCG